MDTSLERSRFGTGLIRRTALTIGALAILLTGGALASPAANAAEPEVNDAPTAQTEFTEDQWSAAVDELIASDVARTVEPAEGGDLYTFQIPVDDQAVPGGLYPLTAFVPDDNAAPAPGQVTPQLGWGEDSRGPFLILNKFDQDLLTGGAIQVIGLAACALPGIGWVSCGVIQGALLVASAGISQLPKPCPDQAKVYLFQQYNRVGCYP